MFWVYRRDVVTYRRPSDGATTTLVEDAGNDPLYPVKWRTAADRSLTLEQWARGEQLDVTVRRKPLWLKTIATACIDLAAWVAVTVVPSRVLDRWLAG